MSKIPKGESFEKPANKNIKNIYVHKINSLMKISRDNLVEDQVQTLVHNKGQLSQNLGHKRKLRKFILKVTLKIKIVDKNSLKLQKNRESARKARQRKNLYIKLLEGQVQFLKKQLAESENIENSSILCLKNIKGTVKSFHNSVPTSTVEEDLDKYISQDDLVQLTQVKIRDDKKNKMIQQVTNQYQAWFVPGLLKNITSLKKIQRAELNKKMLKAAEDEFQKDSQHLTQHKQNHIKMLLPFQQFEPTMKISNLVKTLGKNTEQINMLLERLGELSKELKQLLSHQQVCMQMNEVLWSRVRNIVIELKLCQIGDKPQKMASRIIRWEQFPQINMVEIMHKIVQFNEFIENTCIDIQALKEKDEESEMSDEKQTDKPRN